MEVPAMAGGGAPPACLIKTGLVPGDPSRQSLGPFNSLLRSLSEARLPGPALSLFCEALSLSPQLPVDPHTFPAVLAAAAALPGGGPFELPQLHALAHKTGFARHLPTSNSLLHSYSLSGGPALARHLFDRMPVRDAASWNSLIKAHVAAGDLPAALETLQAMPADSRNVVSWTTAVHGLAAGGQPESALELFRQMQLSGLSPDGASLTATLSACAQLGALEHALWAAVFTARRRLPLDPPLACALIDTLCKCGEPAAARRLFDGLPPAAANVRVWTAMISGLGANGQGQDALQLFKEMPAAGVTPNELTLTAILSACAASGMAAEGKAIFRRLESGEFRCRTRVEHLGCMTQILARAGETEQARAVAERGGSPAAFGALAAACRDQADWQLGAEVGEILVEMDGEDGGRYVGLAAVLEASGRMEEAARVRKRMKRRGVKKAAGCSTIAVAGEVHEFLA